MKQLILGMLLLTVLPFMAQETNKEVPPKEIQIKTAARPG